LSISLEIVDHWGILFNSDLFIEFFHEAWYKLWSLITYNFWEIFISLKTCSHRFLATSLDVMFIVIRIYHEIFENLSTTTTSILLYSIEMNRGFTKSILMIFWETVRGLILPRHFSSMFFSWSVFHDPFQHLYLSAYPLSCVLKVLARHSSFLPIWSFYSKLFLITWVSSFSAYVNRILTH